ncbi:MAG: type II toxin-antitoxin system VapC family toxin [Rhodobacteraceae bacterium]|nr:type II toxin-antitoxin system VapC family toxin [Paracoccaceae bacterium]
MSAAFLLDASALLAAMMGEEGTEAVEAKLTEAQIGAVNASEVVAKLTDKGFSGETAQELFEALLLPVVDFDAATAMRAGQLRPSTRMKGLSLGDRACLAQAEVSGCPVLTADRAWAGLDLGVDVQVIR